jgi:NADH dehydrogenase
MNNVAWLLRRFPVFAIAGDGRYRVRPVHVDDVANLCVEAAGRGDTFTVNAVGPETMTFEQMVLRIRSAVGSRSRIIHVPTGAAKAAAAVVGLAVRDVVITDHELGGLMSELAYADGPPTGQTRFSDWIVEEGPRLGRRYASEVVRHFTSATEPRRGMT